MKTTRLTIAIIITLLTLEYVTNWHHFSHFPIGFGWTKYLFVFTKCVLATILVALEFGFCKPKRQFKEEVKSLLEQGNNSLLIFSILQIPLFIFDNQIDGRLIFGIHSVFFVFDKVLIFKILPKLNFPKLLFFLK